MTARENSHSKRNFVIRDKVDEMRCTARGECCAINFPIGLLTNTFAYNSLEVKDLLPSARSPSRRSYRMKTTHDRI